MKLPTYNRWEDVPQNLKTKTQLSLMGLRPKKDQSPVALKTSRDWRVPDYNLYDIALAIPKRQPTPAQLERLAQGRKTAHLNRICSRCGNAATKDRLCDDCRRIIRDRKESISIAANWLAGNNIILDTETTGLNGEIVQLGIIDMAGNTLLDTFIAPTVPISYGAYQIHRIDDSMLRGAPTMAELWPSLQEIFKRTEIVIIYNSYRWQPLDGGDHSAIGDCRATLALLQRMATSKSNEE